MPPDRDAAYILSADLGTANVPNRGTSAFMVFDVSSIPVELAAFNWVSGGGSWIPGLNTLKYYQAKYKGYDVLFCSLVSV